MIGKKVKVFWPVDESWYTGVVQEFDPSTGEHCLQYIDGDTEWVKIGDLSGQQQQQPPPPPNASPPHTNPAISLVTENSVVTTNTTTTMDRPSNTITTTEKSSRSSYGKGQSSQYNDDSESPSRSSNNNTSNTNTNNSGITVIEGNEDIPTTRPPPEVITDKDDTLTSSKVVSTYYEGSENTNGPSELSGKSTSPYPYNMQLPSMYTSAGSTAMSVPPFGGHIPPPQSHLPYMYQPPQYGPPPHLTHLPPPYHAQLHHPMMMSHHHHPYDPALGMDHPHSGGMIGSSSGDPMIDYPPPGGVGNNNSSDMMHLHMMNSFNSSSNNNNNNNRDNGSVSHGGSRSRKSGPKPWTKEEDNLLLNLVHTMQWPMKWTVVAHSLPDRTGKQCRERYVNHLNPRLKNSDWAPIEDATIFHLYNTIGSHWAKMSKIIPGRTDNGIKNRFHNIRRQYEREDTHRLRLSNVEEYIDEVRHDRLRNFPEHMSGKSLSLWDMKCGIGIMAAQSILNGSSTCNTISGLTTLNRISSNAGVTAGNVPTQNNNRFGPFREVAVVTSSNDTESNDPSKSSTGDVNTKVELCVRCGLIVPSIHTGNEICTKTGWCISCVFIPPNICSNLLRETLNLRRCCVDITISSTNTTSISEANELRSIIESFDELFHPTHPEDAWPYKATKSDITSMIQTSTVTSTTESATNDTDPVIVGSSTTISSSEIPLATGENELKKENMG
jgi:Myb-like DNA-binding domain